MLIPAACQYGSKVVTTSAGTNIATKLAGMKADEILYLKNGTYPFLNLANKDFGGVTIMGESRDGVVIQGMNLKAVKRLAVTNVSITGNPSASSPSVKIYGRSETLAFHHVKVTPRTSSGFELGQASKFITINDTIVDGSKVNDASGWGIWGGDWDNSGNLSDIAITNSTLRYTHHDLIHMSGATRLNISRNTFTSPDSSDMHADGIQFTVGNDVTIDRNVFTAPDGPFTHNQAMMIGDHDGKTTNVKITNNLVHHWQGLGIVVAGANNSSVINNTFISNGDGNYPGPSLSAVAGETSNLTIKNNIVERMGGAGSSGTYVEAGNCVISGGKGGNVSRLGLDPKTFRPLPGSPCIDRGVSGAPSVDLYNVARSSKPDAGAIESGSTALPVLSVGAVLAR